MPKPESASLPSNDVVDGMPITSSQLHPAAVVHSSNSEDEDGDEDSHNRTTSIVENMLVSSDFNSHSCEDLTAVVPPLLKVFKDYSSGNHSDSEVVSDRNKQNHRSKSHRSHVEIVPKSHHQEQFQGNKSKVLVGGEWSGSPAQNKPRPTAYDHLVPKDLQQQSSHPVTQSLTFVPPSGTPNFAGPQPSEDTSDVSVCSPTHSRHTTPPPEQVVSSRKESTFERKVKVTRRQHFYEDVDLPDEPATNLSGSSSPESCSSLPKKQEQVDPYTRKVSVTGHFHSYEDVTPSSELQEVHSGSSTPEAPSDWVQSRLPSYGSMHFSPTHKKPLESLSNSTRKPLPLQQVEMGDSAECHEMEPDDTLRSRVSKKPVPTPRRVQKREECTVTNQHSSPPTQGGLDGDGHTIDTSLCNDTFSGKQLQAVPFSQDVATSGLMSFVNEDDMPPALPPKPHSEHSSYLSSLPRIPKKPRDITCEPNYMLVDIPTMSVSASLPAELKPSETTRKRDERVVYSQISHIKTQQLGNMIVERNKEKNQTNPRQ